MCPWHKRRAIRDLKRERERKKKGEKIRKISVPKTGILVSDFECLADSLFKLAVILSPWSTTGGGSWIYLPAQNQYLTPYRDIKAPWRHIITANKLQSRKQHTTTPSFPFTPVNEVNAGLGEGNTLPIITDTCAHKTCITCKLYPRVPWTAGALEKDTRLRDGGFSCRARSLTFYEMSPPHHGRTRSMAKDRKHQIWTRPEWSAVGAKAFYDCYCYDHIHIHVLGILSPVSKELGIV